jgi:hypothetical protein
MTRLDQPHDGSLRSQPEKLTDLIEGVGDSLVRISTHAGSIWSHAGVLSPDRTSEGFTLLSQHRFEYALTAVVDAGGPNDWGEWQRCCSCITLDMQASCDDWQSAAGHRSWFDRSKDTPLIWSRLGDLVPPKFDDLKSDFTRWRIGERRALSLAMKRLLLSPIRQFLNDEDWRFSLWWLEGSEGSTMVRGSSARVVSSPATDAEGIDQRPAIEILPKAMPERRGGPHIKDRMIAAEMWKDGVNDSMDGSGWRDDTTAAPAWVIRRELELAARERERELRQQGCIDFAVHRGDPAHLIAVANHAVKPILDRYFATDS